MGKDNASSSVARDARAVHHAGREDRVARTAPCMKCKKMVSVTGYGRCGVCGDVVADESVPSAAALAAGDAFWQAVKLLGAIALGAFGGVLVLHSIQKGTDGKTYVIPWALVPGIIMLVGFVRVVFRRVMRG